MLEQEEEEERSALTSSCVALILVLNSSAGLSRRLLDDGPFIPNPSNKCSLGAALEQEPKQRVALHLPMSPLDSWACMAARIDMSQRR